MVDINEARVDDPLDEAEHRRRRKDQHNRSERGGHFRCEHRGRCRDHHRHRSGRQLDAGQGPESLVLRNAGMILVPQRKLWTRASANAGSSSTRSCSVEAAVVARRQRSPLALSRGGTSRMAAARRGWTRTDRTTSRRRYPNPAPPARWECGRQGQHQLSHQVRHPASNS